MRFPARFESFLLVVVVTLLVGGCTPSETTEDSGDQVAIPDAEPALKIPEEASNRENPIAASVESVASGQRTFSNMCSPCHGMAADGTGELARHLEVDVPNFTDPEEQEKFSDGDLFYILTHGHAAMPAQEDRLEDELKWDLVNYIRSLNPNN